MEKAPGVGVDSPRVRRLPQQKPPQRLERGKALRPPTSTRTGEARRLADARLADSPAASAAHMPVPGVAAMEVDEEAVERLATRRWVAAHVSLHPPPLVGTSR